MEPINRAQTPNGSFSRSLPNRPISMARSRPVISPVRDRPAGLSPAAPVLQPTPVSAPVTATPEPAPVVVEAPKPAPAPVQAPTPVQAAPTPAPVRPQPSMPSPSQGTMNDFGPMKPAQPVAGKPRPAVAPMSPDFDVASFINTPVTPAPRPAESTLPVRVKAPAKRFAHLKGRLLTGVLSFGAVLILAGGSAAAYFTQVIPNRPDNVLLQALANSMNAKVTPQTFKGSLNSVDYQIAMSGGVGTNGAYSLLADATINGETARIESLSADGKSLYVRGNSIAALLSAPTTNADSLAQTMLDLYAPLLKQMDGQWYQFGSPVKTMSKADAAKLAAIYREHTFLSISSIQKDEVVNGIDSYHYQVTIEKEALRNFLIALRNARIANFNVSLDKLSLLNDTIRKADFIKHPIDVWIGKDNKRIDQVAFNVNGISLQMSFSDFGKPYNVTAPTAAKPSSDIYRTVQAVKSDDALYQSGIMDGSNSGIGVLLMVALQ